MVNFLDFGSPGLRRGITIAVLIYFALLTFGVLPESLATGEIVGISYQMIAGVGASLSAVWIGSRMLMMT